MTVNLATNPHRRYRSKDPASILEHFAELPDPRREHGKVHMLDEIVFIPALPVRVEQVNGIVGSTASGPVMSVTDNQIVIDSSLPLDVAPLV